MYSERSPCSFIRAMSKKGDGRQQTQEPRPGDACPRVPGPKSALEEEGNEDGYDCSRRAEKDPALNRQPGSVWSSVEPALLVLIPQLTTQPIPARLPVCR